MKTFKKSFGLLILIVFVGSSCSHKISKDYFKGIVVLPIHEDDTAKNKNGLIVTSLKPNVDSYDRYVIYDEKSQLEMLEDFNLDDTIYFQACLKNGIVFADHITKNISSNSQVNNPLDFKEYFSLNYHDQFESHGTNVHSKLHKINGGIVQVNANLFQFEGEITNGSGTNMTYLFYTTNTSLLSSANASTGVFSPNLYIEKVDASQTYSATDAVVVTISQTHTHK